jgi:hypothetical protein
VLELYGDEPPLVIATVTAWEPGSRVVYRGVVDDTETVVTFSSIERGTRVHVHQRALPDATRAFMFWPNVVGWFVTQTGQHAQIQESER